MTTKAMDKCNETKCSAAPTYTVRPKARVFENDESFILEAEMPGIGEANAEITVHRNELKVSGENDDLEFRYERRFKLPEVIDSNKVSASMRFGILKVVLPKSEEAKPKTIKVIAG